MIFAFPIGVEKEIRKTPWITYLLLFLSVVVYLIQYVVLPEWMGRRSELLSENFGFLGFQHEPWRALTYSFIHQNLYDLFVNMLFLFLLGVAVEDAIGWWKTLLLYLLGAVGGAALYAALMNSPSPAPLLGPLAPVCALAGTCLIMMPRLQVTIGYGYWFFWFWRGAGTFGLPAILLLLFYFVQAHLPVETVLSKILPGLLKFSNLRQFDAGFPSSALWLQAGGIAVGIAMGLIVKGLRGFRMTDEEEAAQLAREIEKKRIAEEQALAKQPSDQSLGLDQILTMPEQQNGPPPDPALLALLVSSKQSDKALAEYARWLRQDPRATLAPDPQTDLARLLIDHGANEVALVALNNLIDKYPKTQQAKTALLMAGEVASGIPSKRTMAFGFLNRFLSSAPSKADQDKAQQLLQTLRQDLLVVDTQEFGIDLQADFSEKTRKVAEEKETFFRPALSDSESPLALNLSAESFGPDDRKETLAGTPMEEKIDEAGPISLDDIIAARKKEKQAQSKPEPAQLRKPNIPPPPGSIDIDPDAPVSIPSVKNENHGEKPASFNLGNLPPAKGSKVPPPPVLFTREEMEELVNAEEVTLDDDEPEFASDSAGNEGSPVFSVLLRQVKASELSKAIEQTALLTRRTPESLQEDALVQQGILLSRVSQNQTLSFAEQLHSHGISVQVLEDFAEDNPEDVTEARELRVEGEDWHWVTNKGTVEMRPASISMLSCGSVRFFSSGRRKCAIDIYQLEPWLHLRLKEDVFRAGEAQGIDGFPPSGPDCSAAEAMRDLSQRLAEEAPHALMTGAFQDWVDPAGEALPRRFHDVEHYDAYNRRRLLARLGKRISTK